MKHSVSRELFAYWDRLRGTRMAPERADIDPAEIRGALADTFVLEVTGGLGDRDYVVRLAGTRLDALAMQPLKGRSFPALFGNGETSVARVLGIVLDDQVPVVGGVSGAPHRRDEPIDLEMLLLPLRHHGKTHSRMLGSMAARHVPSWLGLRPLDELVLLSFRTLSTAARTARPPRRDPGASPEATVSRQGRFTVYQGGRERGGMFDRL